MDAEEKMLRLAACVGRQVGDGVPVNDAVNSAARCLDVAPATVWHAVHFAQDLLSDPEIRQLTPDQG
jgi:hypothetical protein